RDEWKENLPNNQVTYEENTEDEEIIFAPIVYDEQISYEQDAHRQFNENINGEESGNSLGERSTIDIENSQVEASERESVVPEKSEDRRITNPTEDTDQNEHQKETEKDRSPDRQETKSRAKNKATRDDMIKLKASKPPEADDFCFCHKPAGTKSYIKCDNNTCPIQWIHKSCAKIKGVIRTKWYCSMQCGLEAANMWMEDV
ncbi:hypothetical protein SNEBB_005776, partial [Seison nebaliae]